MYECDVVFEILKQKLIFVFIFGYFDVIVGDFILDIDVSNDVIGVVLL